MKDFIPSLTYKYEPAKDWAVTQEHREDPGQQEGHGQNGNRSMEIGEGK